MRQRRLKNEINVVPYIDVMLVLLVIFMVTAPMMTVGVPIDLPETQAKAMNSDTQPITISVNPAGEIYLQETPIALDEVVAKLEVLRALIAASAGEGYALHLCQAILEEARALSSK